MPAITQSHKATSQAVATAELVSPRSARSERIRHTTLVLFTAGSSLFSRASTAGMLVIAARRLSTGGLGVFATLFGIAIAAAYVLASTSGNILAYWTRANPLMTVRTGRIVFAAGALSLIVSLPLYIGLVNKGALDLVAATLALLVAGLAATVTLQLLRGAGRLVLGVTAGFLIPSILRLGLSLMLPAHVLVAQMLSACAVAAALGALTGSIALISLQHADLDIPSFTYHWSLRLSLAAGTVGLMWFALGQIDLTSLTLIRGSTAGGEYAPTMRAFEAMNALGLAVALVSIRALAGVSAQTAVARMRRIVPPSLALYALITLPLLLFGHTVLTKLLHRHVFWAPIPVICLSIGYGGNLVMAVCFETLASQRATSLLLRLALIILLISLAVTPFAVASFGITGAAIGNSLSYFFGGLLIFILLTRNALKPSSTVVQQTSPA
jgi:hypothetical protein